MRRSINARRGSTRRRLCFEQCESRQLLAVTTTYDSGTGNLTVTGDGNADVIAIFGTSNAGEFTIQGSGTTVDGGSSATISGVRGSLIVDLNGGNDVLNMDNVYLAGNLTVDTDDGDDVVVFGASGVVSAQGTCQVRSNSGSDLFRAEPYKAFFGGALLVTDGNFDGAVSLIGASGATGVSLLGIPQAFLQGVTSGGQLVVQSSSNVNNIALFTSAASDKIRIIAPSGRNSIYIDTCYSGVGIYVEAFSPYFPSIPHDPEVPPYNIDATITIARCQTRQLFVDTTGVGFRPSYSGGDDTVQLYGNYVVGPAANPAGTLTVRVDTGDGRDNVSASYNIILDELFVMLAQMDDSLVLVGNQVTGLTNCDGGPGTNRLTQLGNQFGASSFSFFS